MDLGFLGSRVPDLILMLRIAMIPASSSSRLQKIRVLPS